jgi:hypothetical protein
VVVGGGGVVVGAGIVGGGSAAGATHSTTTPTPPTAGTAPSTLTAKSHVPADPGSAPVRPTSKSAAPPGPSMTGGGSDRARDPGAGGSSPGTHPPPTQHACQTSPIPPVAVPVLARVMRSVPAPVPGAQVPLSIPGLPTTPPTVSPASRPATPPLRLTFTVSRWVPAGGYRHPTLMTNSPVPASTAVPRWLQLPPGSALTAGGVDGRYAAHWSPGAPRAAATYEATSTMPTAVQFPGAYAGTGDPALAAHPRAA